MHPRDHATGQLFFILSDHMTTLASFRKAVILGFTTLLETLEHSIRDQRRDYDSSHTHVKAINMAQRDVMHLDVGGCNFHIGISTVIKQENMLSGMAQFSNETGLQFVDRDASLFPLILHFLRTGVVLIPRCQKGALLREAEFYSIGCTMRHTMAEFLAFGFRKSYSNQCSDGVLQTYAWRTYRSSDQQRCELPWGSDMQMTACAGTSAFYALVVDPTSLRSRFYTTNCGIWRPLEVLWAPFSYHHSLIPTSLVQSGTSLYAFDLFLQTTLEFCLKTRKRRLLPKRRYQCPPYTTGATVCLCGGQAFVLYESFAEVFCLRDETWKRISPMPGGISEVGAVDVDGTLVVTGGRTANFHPVDTLLRYNHDSDTWTAMGSSPTARYGHASIMFNSTLLLVGGEPHVIDRYHFGRQTWDSFPSGDNELYGVAVIRTDL
jgi:hypothetical protein